MNNDSGQSIGNNSFLGRAFLYAGIGLLFKLRGRKLANFTFLGSVAERALGFPPEQVLQEWLSQRQEKERQEKVKQILQNLAASIRQVPIQLSQKTETSSALYTAKQIMTEQDSRWLKVIIHPSVLLVLGKRGSGKSGLGYRLLELFRYRLIPYVLGIPAQAQKLLPDWIGVAQDLDEIPQGSIVLEAGRCPEE